jgi:hypothetical protein
MAYRDINSLGATITALTFIDVPVSSAGGRIILADENSEIFPLVVI